MKYSILLAALTSAVFTGAHSIVDEIRAGDVDYPGYNPYHDPEKNPVPKRIVWAFPTAMNGPTTDLTLPDIACNKGAQPALLVAPAKAGSKVRFHWQPWPETHKGPIMTYMANCNGDCKNADPTKLDFFKIDEAGLYPSGEWATMDFIHNKNTTWTVTIPSDIVAGNYLIRQELVSLHSADQAGRAQFYPMCANLEISGTGTARPAGVRFPGAYKATDPGILVDIAKIKTYQIPGPPVYVPGSAPASAPVDSPVDKPAQPVYSHNNATTPTTPEQKPSSARPSCSSTPAYKDAKVAAPTPGANYPAVDAKSNTPPTTDNKYPAVDSKSNTPDNKYVDSKSNTPDNTYPAVDSKSNTPDNKYVDSKSKTPDNTYPAVDSKSNTPDNKYIDSKSNTPDNTYPAVDSKSNTPDNKPAADTKYDSPAPAVDAKYNNPPTTTFSTVTRMPKATGTPRTGTLHDLKKCLHKANDCIHKAKCTVDLLECESQRTSCYAQLAAVGDYGCGA